MLIRCKQKIQVTDITESGFWYINTFHPQNDPNPMLVIELGRITDFKILQLKNARFPIEDTPRQMTTDVLWSPFFLLKGIFHQTRYCSLHLVCLFPVYISIQSPFPLMKSIWLFSTNPQSISSSIFHTILLHWDIICPVIPADNVSFLDLYWLCILISALLSIMNPFS